MEDSFGDIGDNMSVDQKRRRHWCGYCGEYLTLTWEEMDAHLHICEELTVAKYKLRKPHDKNPAQGDDL